MEQWRRQRRYERKAVVKAVKPETLLERVMRFARRKGLQVFEKTFCVDFAMQNGDILTVYRLPARSVNAFRVSLYYGEIFHPSRRYGRRTYIDEKCAEFIYKRLGEVEKELKKE